MANLTLSLDIRSTCASSTRYFTISKWCLSQAWWIGDLPSYLHWRRYDGWSIKNAYQLKRNLPCLSQTYHIHTVPQDIWQLGDDHTYRHNEWGKFATLHKSHKNMTLKMKSLTSLKSWNPKLQLGCSLPLHTPPPGIGQCPEIQTERLHGWAPDLPVGTMVTIRASQHHPKLIGNGTYNVGNLGVSSQRVQYSHIDEATPSTGSVDDGSSTLHSYTLWMVGDGMNLILNQRYSWGWIRSLWSTSEIILVGNIFPVPQTTPGPIE